MADIRQEIIDYIRRNRVSTTEVADCLGKSGALSEVMPLNGGHFKVGPIKWVYAYDESNWPVHEQLATMEENHVIMVSAFDCAERALFGELVSKYLILYQQSEAIVVDGYMRDAAALKRENYPVWCKGVTPIGCFNKQPETPYAEEIVSEYREKYDGAIAVCDDCGVVVIENNQINHELLERLKQIEAQEDIWFERLDKYKENTFDIVCLKKYLL